MVDYYIERLNINNATKWEEFNNNSNEGSFFHSLKWKQIIENSLDFRTHYFLLFKNTSVSGIFPFIEQKTHLFNGFVPPETDHRNAIIQDYSDASCIQFIIKEFQKYTEKQKKFSYFCFSTLHKEIIDNLKNFPVFPYADDGNMILNLREFPPERIWETFSSQKKRIKFRRLEKKGYSVTELNSHDDLKMFYKYYKENLDFIGGTPHSFSHFSYLWNNLSSNEMRITVLSKSSTIAGALLMFPYKPQKTVYFRYLSLNRKLPNLSPSYYLHWDAINWAWNNNYEKISFGAQHFDENNPRYRFKKEFGANFEPVYSKLISFSNIFALVHNCKYYVDRIVNTNRALLKPLVHRKI